MSTYLGTQLLAGVATDTISNGHSLLDFKWTDHIINSMEWLRADTFSWQSGDVYVAAYNHLVADYQGGTSQTETVGSYTISYVLAIDGHKITTDETTVSNIYAESGVAWYYILDTTNQRFKLPRSSHGNIVEKYQDGTEWYRVYSDGWCEQGGTVSLNECSTAVVTYNKVFADTNYSLSAIQTILSTAADTEVGIQFTPTSTSQGTISCHYINPNTTTVSWKVCGYLATVPENSQYKYIYFYVGEFSQSATEQTAGITTAQLNAKVDLDLDNMTPSATAKETIVGWGIPDYTAGVAISTGYVAVSNGMVLIVRGGGSGGVSLFVDGVRVDGNYSNTTNEGGCLFAFVKKGSTVTWNTGNISDAPTFFPCVGG